MRSNATKYLLFLLVFTAMLLAPSCSNNNNDNNVGEGFLIVANSMDDSLSIIRDSDRTVVATVMLTGDFPWAIALSGNQTVAYVMNRDSNSVSIVDLPGGMELATVALTNAQPGKAVLASDGFLYVTHANAAVVTKVDVQSMMPAEVATIPITAAGSTWITPGTDGSSLYVGSRSDSNLCKIDLATAVEVFTSNFIDIADFKIAPNGTAYAVERFGTEVHLFDTLTDTWLPDTIAMTAVTQEFAEIRIRDGKVFVAANTNGYSGGVAEFDVGWDQADFQFACEDDDFYDVGLPFTFTFLGMPYTAVSMNSNGAVGMGAGNYVSYDDGVETILGFAINNEDLDSSDTFNYSSRFHSNRAVFNWHTSCNFDEPNVNYFFTGEIVLYADGGARFSYLNSGPLGEPDEDDGYSYGVGDGAVALVNLRPMYGSPFSLQRQTFHWDPVAPNVMVPGAFEWEGTGLHFSPAIHLPDALYVESIAVTSRYIYMVGTFDYNGLPVSDVVVYDRNTMLPVAPIAVGMEPAAIVLAQY